MTYDELIDFLQNRMSMRHIYQPLVIRKLLEDNGISTVRNLASELLAYDEAQVEYYIKILKRWPKITLKNHGVIEASRNEFALTVDVEDMSQQQKSALIDLCNEKVAEYISQYEGIIGDYRYNPSDLGSGSIRYQVLKLAKGRCALCGASVKDTAIDVDHIVPRSKGGTNDMANLQALCARCNRAKKANDDADFRGYGVDELLEVK